MLFPIKIRVIRRFPCGETKVFTPPYLPVSRPRSWSRWPAVNRPGVCVCQCQDLDHGHGFALVRATVRASMPPVNRPGNASQLKTSIMAGRTTHAGRYLPVSRPRSWSRVRPGACHRQGFDAGQRSTGRALPARSRPRSWSMVRLGVCQWSRLQFRSGETLTPGGQDFDLCRVKKSGWKL